MNRGDAPDDLPFALPVASRTSRRRVALVLVLLFGAAFVLGFVRVRSARTSLSAQAATARRTVRVEVVHPKTQETGQTVQLPGVIKPLEEAQIYPRASGYVRNWYVDIGDTVAAGQLLAEIAAPELEAQLAQAKAQQAQAQAMLKLATAQHDFSNVNAQRYGALAGEEMVSKSTADQTATQAATDAANVAAAKATVASQAANVRRLRESMEFTKITAPFAGRIARRGIDRGTLVSEGNSTEMFDLVATDPIRVFIDVPQNVASSVRAGVEAKISVREFGARVFTGKVTRAASALDPSLHTMTTEIQVPNTDGTLLPGMYVRASLSLSTSHRVVEIPATALYSDASGLRVAKVDKQQKVHFVSVTIERDTGATLLISAGLSSDDAILKIAVPTLVEGDSVEVSAP